MLLELGVEEMWLTVNDEDVEVARCRAGNTNEMDVVLRKSHRRLIIRTIRRRLDVVPRNSIAARRNKRAHIEVPKLAIQHRI